MLALKFIAGDVQLSVPRQTVRAAVRRMGGDCVGTLLVAERSRTRGKDVSEEVAGVWFMPDVALRP